MNPDDLVTVPLPADAGIEPVPSDPGRYRLVLHHADLMRLGLEVDLARGVPTPHPTTTGVEGRPVTVPPVSPAPDQWLPILRDHGISQVDALRHVRHCAEQRGEPPPSSLRAAADRPAAVRDLEELIVSTARTHEIEVSPW